ncbi:hypothetical protein JEQ12_007045 [Ovis aries]|uniref:Uncharacterized protein n=1 Tax=Ovis aries TaxID=9940 RepID=A0A835ZS73_SHEEP|nr:hypothetical protein JEQ12_007045 [Ovis aries]
MDEETKRKKMTEKVVSFLLVDENEEIQFLGDASEAYLKHFTKELKATTARCGLDVPLPTLGPAVIIFNETVHTQLLGSDHPSEVPEKLIQDRF